MSDIVKHKAENLSKRINQIASSLSKQIDVSDSLNVQADDVVEYVENKLPDINVSIEDSINVQTMLDDFIYVRNVLKENTECARNMLKHVSANMIGEDDSVTAAMLRAFSELNKSITENMKLYVLSYKELSATLANIKHSASRNNVTNNLTINACEQTEVISVKDIIEKLKEDNK